MLPLGSAAVAYAVRQRRRLAIGLCVVTALACAAIAVSMLPNTATVFLGQEWALYPIARPLLAGLYLVTAALLAIAAMTEKGDVFCAPALASTGLLSATILLRSPLLSCLLLSAALAVLVLAAFPAATSLQGASCFLALVTVPIPFMLGCFTLLERFALFPDELALAGLSALLVVPPIVVWLTLFPLHSVTRLWAAKGVPLAPAFLWIVKDWVVVYLLFTLWCQYPVLHSETATALLGIAGLATALVSGVWAYLQSNPAALLACAAMSELGIAWQGIMSGSTDGVVGGLSLLMSRAAAILLACSALTALCGNLSAYEAPIQGLSSRRKGFLLLAFAVGILALTGLPPLVGFWGRRQIYAALQPQGLYLLLTWLSATFGIVLGLVRTVWTLWHAQVESSSEHSLTLPLFLVLAFLLLCLWLNAYPQAMQGLASDLARHLPPLSSL
jgi:NADH:ubiquinone oxidoreductase subunit 2 (subunit N)